MKIGLLWELKLFEVPLIFVTSSYLIASFTYEDSIRELVEHLEIQRFASCVVLAIAFFSLVMKIMHNSI